jgi:acetyl esterase/lipase
MRTFTLPLTNEHVTLTAYLLEDSHEMRNARERPAVLIFPGGAYRVCSGREAEPIAMAFLAEGYQAFILHYSLNDNAAFPKPLNDAEEALERIRSNSGDWGIDPEKIAACGFSAGGHLAAALGTMGRVKPNALVLGYPCILSSMSGILPVPIPSVDESVDASTPPAFLFHTFADSLVPVSNSLAFAGAMNRAKVPFELHIFTNGTHGLSLAKPHTSGGLRKMVDAEAAAWFGLCLAWLNRLFGGFVGDQETILNETIDRYGVDVQLGVLWNNPTCKQLVLSAIPALADSAQLEDAMVVPLRAIIEFGGGLLREDALNDLDIALQAIPVR